MFAIYSDRNGCYCGSPTCRVVVDLVESGDGTLGLASGDERAGGQSELSRLLEMIIRLVAKTSQMFESESYVLQVSIRGVDEFETDKLVNILPTTGNKAPALKEGT